MEGQTQSLRIFPREQSIGRREGPRRRWVGIGEGGGFKEEDGLWGEDRVNHGTLEGVRSGDEQLILREFSQRGGVLFKLFQNGERV